MHAEWCFVCGRRFSGRGGLYFHIYNYMNRNPEDREHLALYALSTARRSVRGQQRYEQLYLPGLDVLEKMTEVRLVDVRD
ncbi:MAG: hypothetical protein ACXQTN_05925 [Methanoculleaceae archaeon]